MNGAFMKALVHVIVKLTAACFVVALAASASAAQERGRLRLDTLDRLAPKASETVHVEIDAGLIGFGCTLLSDEDPEEKQVKEMCAGLKGVYVRGFEFGAGGQFAESDVTPLREQLRGPGWSRLVDVGSHGDDLERAEVYAATEAGRVEGLVLIFVEAKELTVINIVGSVDLAKLRRLGRVLNLPKIRVERRKKKIVSPDPRP